MWVWYLDRSSAMAALVALWLSVLTGIPYNARTMGWLHRASRKIHVPASVVASVTILLHVGVGTYDAALVLARQVPHPAYGDAYFAMGLLVGLAALIITIVAVLAFTDPKRFQRPWDPRSVHLFAYAGFIAAVIHAVALGTDVYELVKPGLVAATLLVAYALGQRYLTERAFRPAPAPAPPRAPAPEEPAP